MKIKLWLKKLNFKSIVYVMRTVEKFYIDACSYQAATLTFYTLFALVPFLGLMFGLAKSFGFEDSLKTAFRSLLEGQEQVYDNLLVFSENLLNQTKEAIIAGVGLIILLWSVFKVIRVLDYVFNKIWAIQAAKNPMYRAHQFAAIILLMPIIMLVVGGALLSSIQVLSTMLPQELQLKWFQILPYQTKIVSFILFTAVMGLSYWGIPNIKLSMRGPLIAGIVASLAFHALQYLYVNFQQDINEFGVVYGSFASIPLFMLWIYASWLIYLLGAELSFVIESRVSRSWELKLSNMPVHVQRGLSLEVMHLIIENFKNGKPPLPLIAISENLSIPLTLTRFLLDRLSSAQLVHQAKPNLKKGKMGYLPSKPLELLTDGYMIHHIEHAHVDGGKKHEYGPVIGNILLKQQK